MAQEKYVYGIKSVKFGTPTGSSTMPAASAMTAWAQTVRGSFTLSEDEAQKKEFKVEEASSPVKEIVTDAGALTGKWRAYDLTPALVAVVKGGASGTSGAGSAAMVTYAGPTSVVAMELALEVTTTNNVVINVYKASVLGRFDGGVSAESLLELEVTAKALDPGTGTSPYMLSLPNPS
ncbi:MAG TPA: hypothetical protein DHV48_03650 [Prolixibacteraceae bacterium]|nr:hypothetical protein [Prolixibacteraceae bacterium]